MSSPLPPLSTAENQAADCFVQAIRLFQALQGMSISNQDLRTELFRANPDITLKQLLSLTAGGVASGVGVAGDAARRSAYESNEPSLGAPTAPDTPAFATPKHQFQKSFFSELFGSPIAARIGVETANVSPWFSRAADESGRAFISTVSNYDHASSPTHSASPTSHMKRRPVDAPESPLIGALKRVKVRVLQSPAKGEGQGSPSLGEDAATPASDDTSQFACHSPYLANSPPAITAVFTGSESASARSSGSAPFRPSRLGVTAGHAAPIQISQASHALSSSERTTRSIDVPSPAAHPSARETSTVPNSVTRQIGNSQGAPPAKAGKPRKSSTPMHVMATFSLRKLPSNEGTLSEIADIIAADPRFAPELDWTPRPGTKTYPRWKDALVGCFKRDRYPHLVKADHKQNGMSVYKLISSHSDEIETPKKEATKETDAGASTPSCSSQTA